MTPSVCPECGQVLAAVLEDGRIILEADWRPERYRFAGTPVPAWWFRMLRSRVRGGRPGPAADRYVRNWPRYAKWHGADAAKVSRHEPPKRFDVLPGSIVTCRCSLEVALRR